MSTEVKWTVQFFLPEQLINYHTNKKEDYYFYSRDSLMEYENFIVRITNEEDGTFIYKIYSKSDFRYSESTALKLKDFLMSLYFRHPKEFESCINDIWCCPELDEKYTMEQIRDEYKKMSVQLYDEINNFKQKGNK